MSPATRELLTKERLAIASLSSVLSKLDARPEDVQELHTALEDLEGLFLLVVCGEYNAGKSTFVNALLGEKVMLEGVTPTTDRVTIVTYGEHPEDIEEGEFILRREYPAEILREVAFVDTPGTNAVIKQHQELTERFVPRADLVLFVTSADRPYTESERQFLELIRSWGKKVVVVVNKIDILDEADEKAKVLQYVQDNAAETLKETLGGAPEVFGLAARQAFKARKEGDQSALEASGLPELERYISATIAGEARLKLKLISPLGVAQRLNERYKGVIAGELELLAGDRKTLAEVDRQIAQFKKDMHREFESYLARVKTVLLEVERRGDVYFEDTMRLSKILQLMDTDRMREMFEARVIRGADRDIERAISEMVDWFITRNLQLWEDVMTFVQERRKASDDRVIGEVGGRFNYDRDALIRGLSESAESVMSTYNSDVEARRLADEMQSSALQTGLAQVGGVGLGAALVALLSGIWLDITGIAAGAVVAGLGLFILPSRRRAGKRDLHEQMQQLRDGLSDRLATQFNRELERSVEKLGGAITSYTRFVKSEAARLDALKADLAKSETDLRNLKRAIAALREADLTPEPEAASKEASA